MDYKKLSRVTNFADHKVEDSAKFLEIKAKDLFDFFMAAPFTRVKQEVFGTIYTNSKKTYFGTGLRVEMFSKFELTLWLNPGVCWTRLESTEDSDWEKLVMGESGDVSDEVHKVLERNKHLFDGFVEKVAFWHREYPEDFPKPIELKCFYMDGTQVPVDIDYETVRTRDLRYISSTL